MIRKLGSTLEKFWARVEKTEGCWNWTGGKQGGGYGTLHVGDGRYQLAHRYSYELHIGPIPEGLTLDHKCRNRGCVNPAHLEPVTNRENILRGTSPSALHARKTHCPAGHAYEGDNLIRRRGTRECRQCKIDLDRARRRAAGVGPRSLKTHCHRGHELSGGNLVQSKLPRRGCRICQNMLAVQRRHSNPTVSTRAR